MASAADSSPTGTAPATMAVATDANAAAAQAALADAAAAPTAGADEAMWNAKAGDDTTAIATPEQPGAQPSPDRLGHLVNVRKFAGGIASRGMAMAATLTRNAMRFLGVPYSFGGTSAYGFDCSGYVQHVFAMIGKHLPRTADAQYVYAHKIQGTPKPGDLVFFQTYAPGASHVGISLGGDRFISASSSHGVSVASLHDPYWAARYLGAKRVE